MSISSIDIINAVRKRGRGDPPSAIADLFVGPLVQVLTFLDAKNTLANLRQTVDDIVATLQNSATITSLATSLGESEDSVRAVLVSALDEIASNFGLTRRPAAPSRGSVLLLRTTALSTAITVTAGRRVTAPSLNQDYSVTETTIISSMSFNAELGFFVAAVPIASSNSGLVTVANTSQISRLKDAIPGITGVTNPEPVVGGRDQESDSQLANRIKIALSANNIGTSSGYKTLILSLEDVKDATIVGAGDPLMQRDLGDGGSIDAYITDAIPVTITETTTSTNTSGAIFTPSRQPIINNATVISVTGFAPTTKIITKDNTAFAGSIKAHDTITFDISPPIGTSTITYQTNDIVEKTQAFMDDTSRKLLGQDLLVKEAVTTLVDVIIKIIVLTGFSASTVKTNVEEAISIFVSNLGIGQNLEQSDIIRVVADIDGIDRVDLPPIKFDKQVDTGSVNVIIAGANEVLRIGVVNAVL